MGTGVNGDWPDREWASKARLRNSWSAWNQFQKARYQAVVAGDEIDGDQDQQREKQARGTMQGAHVIRCGPCDELISLSRHKHLSGPAVWPRPPTSIHGWPGAE